MATASQLVKAFLYEGTENVVNPSFNPAVFHKEDKLVVSWSGDTPDGPMAGVARFTPTPSGIQVNTTWVLEDGSVGLNTNEDMAVYLECVLEDEAQPKATPRHYESVYQQFRLNDDVCRWLNDHDKVFDGQY